MAPTKEIHIVSLLYCIKAFKANNMFLIN